MRNEGQEVFHNTFDVVLYMILVIVCPFFSFYVQYNQVNLNNVNTVYILLITCIILCMTLFYDFYTKSLSYGSGGGINSFLLLCGRLAFGFTALSLFLISWALSVEMIEPKHIVEDLPLLYVLVSFPLLLGIWYLCKKRRKKQKKGIISVAGDV